MQPTQPTGTQGEESLAHEIGVPPPLVGRPGTNGELETQPPNCDSHSITLRKICRNTAGVSTKFCRLHLMFYPYHSAKRWAVREFDVVTELDLSRSICASSMVARMALVAVAWAQPGTGHTCRGLRTHTICRGVQIRILNLFCSAVVTGTDRSTSQIKSA